MSTTTPPAVEIPDGPITSLLPRDPRPVLAARLLDGPLRGHATAANWLPADVPELAEVRADHLRIREQIARECGALREQEAAWQREDRDHADALRQAVRAGESEPADERTPAAERDAIREQAAERIWSATGALADVCTEAVDLLREHEDGLLAAERAKYAEAEDRRREALKVVRKADTACWHAAQRAKWLQETADDGAFGRQPFPTPTPPPARLDPAVIRNALERHWSKLRPWNRSAA